MPSSMDALKRERAAYAARCNLVREERHLRLILTGVEEQARQDIYFSCVNLHETLRKNEEGVCHSRSLENREFYFAHLRRNPNSPLPTIQSIKERGNTKRQSSPFLPTIVDFALPFENEITDLLLWEEENRQDLQAWEWDERHDMTLAMMHIITHQRACERKLRERVCETVLNGTTVLDWQSYPRYDD